MYWRTVFDGPFGLDATTFSNEYAIATFGRVIRGKPSFCSSPELGRDGRELVQLPGRPLVVVDQAEQRLLLAAQVAVEGPRQHRLRAEQQAHVGPHPRPALRAVIAAAAGDELVEPDRRRQAGLHHRRLEAGAHGLAGVEAHRAVAHVLAVARQVVEALAPGAVPEVGDRRLVGRVLLADRLQVEERADRHVGPVATQVELALERSRPVAIRKRHLVPGVDAARPALRGPGLVQRLDGAVP